MNPLTRRQFISRSTVAATVLTTAGGIRTPSVSATTSSPTIESLVATDPFTHANARWSGDHDAIVQLRFATTDGLSEWLNLTVSEDSSELLERDVVTTAPLLVGETTYCEVRVLGGIANNLRIEPISVPKLASDALISTSDDLLHATATGAPRVISRAEWGADESIRRGGPQFAPISKLIVHHSDTANSDPNPAATVRAIYQFHVMGNGWDDIGYNFLIDQAGRIYEGRYSRALISGEAPSGEDTSGAGVVGAHALGVNAGSMGVCLLGNFTSQGPTEAATNSLVTLLAWKATVHRIDAFGSSSLTTSNGTPRSFPNISGHRDTYSTSCPGNVLYAQLPAIRDRVASGSAGTVSARSGYLIATSSGAVSSLGLAQSYGSMAGKRLNAPMISLATTKSGLGYWLLGADGGVFTFGDASFFGSTGNMRLNRPVVGLAPTTSGSGYWLVAEDGGVFSFGDAQFYGSTGNIRLNQPIVAMAATPSGHGYWLVAADGGVFCFGDAQFYGSTGSLRLVRPVVSMTRTADGRGYWLVAADGGVFCFGNAQFYGSAASAGRASTATDIAPTQSGQGYWVLFADGSVYSFGDAEHLGGTASIAGRAVGLSRTK